MTKKKPESEKKHRYPATRKPQTVKKDGSEAWKQHYREVNRISARKYRENNLLQCLERERVKARRCSTKYQSKEKNYVRTCLRNAIALGKIKKPKQCEDCGAERALHGHHSDYSKPFQVEWLCSSCHGKRHRKDAILELFKEGI